MSVEYELIIMADTNDGDYITSINKISEEDLGEIKPLLIAIKAFDAYTVEVQNIKWTHHHNYPNSEYLPRTHLGEKWPEDIYPQFSAQLHEKFRDLCPYGQCGFHSIESVTVTPYVEKIKLI